MDKIMTKPRKDSVADLKTRIASMHDEWTQTMDHWKETSLDRDRVKEEFRLVSIAWNESKMENAKLVDQIREMTENHEFQYQELGASYKQMLADLDHARKANKWIAIGVAILFLGTLLFEGIRYTS